MNERLEGQTPLNRDNELLEEIIDKMQEVWMSAGWGKPSLRIERIGIALDGHVGKWMSGEELSELFPDINPQRASSELSYLAIESKRMRVQDLTGKKVVVRKQRRYMLVFEDADEE